MARQIFFSISSSLYDKVSMSWLIFWAVILAYICVVLIFVCPNRRLTVSMGTPCDKSTVVAFVWRLMWKVIGCARKSGQVKIKRKPFEMSFVSAFCQVEKMQIITEY